MELLLTQEADINVKNADDGATALHFGAMQGHSKVAELLLAKRAAVDAGGAVQ